MKITSSRRDDILKRKAEYEADRERRQEAYNAEYHGWLEAQEEVLQPIKEYFEKMFEKYPLLEARVSVGDRMFGHGRLSVDIRVNELTNKFTKALSWNFKAFLKDGELVRETSSWSGMNAVTPDQIAELEQAVAVLKELSNVDWVELLNRELPSFGEYVKSPNPSWEDKPDFDKELREAEMEELIGQRKMIKVRPFDSSWYRNEVYIAIVKDSGSQYTIIECPRYAAEKGEATKYFENGDSHRVKKASLVPVTPTTIIEV